MKRILPFLLGALLFTGISASAQTIPSVSPWFVDSMNRITQRVVGTPVYINGNLTVTGTCTGCGGGGGSGTVSTSSSETANRIPYWTSTNGTPALLSGGSPNLTWDGTKFTTTFASTTAQTIANELFFGTVATSSAPSTLGSLFYNGTSTYAKIGTATSSVANGGFFDLAGDNTIDVFLIAGQSQAQGHGDALYSPSTTPDTVYQYYNGKISVGNDPIGNAINTSGDGQPGGSAWPAFAVTYYKATGHKVLLVPTAVGGTGQSLLADTGLGDWDASSTPSSIAWYYQSVTKLNAALAAIAAAGFNPSFKGVLWEQGENDANCITAPGTAACANSGSETITDYNNAFSAMRARYRALYGATMPFYIFQIGMRSDGLGENGGGWSQVQNAQLQVPVTDPYTKVVWINGVNQNALGYQQDLYHYNQYGLNLMGATGASNLVSGLANLTFQNTASTSPNIYYMAGNVGLGTTSPSSILHIDTGTNDTNTPLYISGNVNDFQQMVIQNSSSGSVASTGYTACNNQDGQNTGCPNHYTEFGMDGSGFSGAASNPFLISSSTADFQFTSINNSAGWQFLTKGNPGTNRLQITAGGNVGIGTTTPYEKLDVFGNIRLGQAPSGFASPATLTVASSTATDAAGGDFTIDASNGNGAGGSGNIIFRTASPMGASGITRPETASSTATATTGTNVTLPFNVPSCSNPLMMVSVAASTGTGTTITASSTLSGNLTQLSSTNVSSSTAMRLAVFYFKSPTAGSDTISVTTSANVRFAYSAATYCGVNQTTPFGTENTATNIGDVGNISATAAAGTKIYDALAKRDTTSLPSPNAGQTQIAQAASASSASTNAIISNSESTPGTRGWTWTVSSASVAVYATIPLNAANIGSADVLTERLRIDPNGNIGIGTTSPGSLLSVSGVANFTTATSTFYSSGGINLTGGGCFAINGTCITGGGGGSGTVTSVATNATLTGGPITTTGTLGLNLANANNWTALQSFSNASSTLLSVTGTSYFGGTATTTIDSAGNLSLPATANITLYGVTTGGVTGTGSVVLSSNPTFGGTVRAAAITGNTVNTGTITLAATNNASPTTAAVTIENSTGANHGAVETLTQTGVGIGTTSPTAIFVTEAASSTLPTGAYTGLIALFTGLENTTLKLFFAIDQWGHQITSGDTPTITGGTSSVSGNDNNGTITVTGTLLTSVTLTFAHAWVTAPDCTMADSSTGVTGAISSISATQMVVGFSAGVNSGTVWYICQGHQ